LPVTTPIAESGDRLGPRIRAGDMDALSAAYRQFAADMLGVAYRLLGSRSDAEDVVHDLFAGLQESLGSYHEDGRFGGWLRQRTARLCLMRIRSGKRRREWSLTESLPQQDLASHASLREAIARLSNEDRTIVLLKAIEGYSHSEIADLLGIRRGTAEVRLHRAMERLRQQMKEDR
jgi:RNA polymerase sigma-70 factor (ECF subfamily)